MEGGWGVYEGSSGVHRAVDNGTIGMVSCVEAARKGCGESAIREFGFYWRRKRR